MINRFISHLRVRAFVDCFDLFPFQHAKIVPLKNSLICLGQICAALLSSVSQKPFSAKIVGLKRHLGFYWI